MNLQVSLQEHRRVVGSCIDVPREHPSFPLPLNEVGISGKTVWIHLPQGRLPFTARIGVDLRADMRGIHMSRLEEVMATLYEQSFIDVRSYALELGREAIRRQEADHGTVYLSGKLPIVRQAAVSQHSSLDTIDISVEARLEKNGAEVAEKTLIGVGVTHITACPCTQVYNRTLFGHEEATCPPPTHSQRSYTTLVLEAEKSRPAYEELLDCLESALHVTQDLLKRPDEAEIVLKAHRCPQFAEDAVRQTAREAGRQFVDVLPPEARVIVETLSFESIHIHDVRCRLDISLGEIVDCLNSSGHDDP